MAAHGPYQKPALSALAVKCKHPEGRVHKILAKKGKSRLTLIKPRHRNAPAPSKARQKYLRELELHREQQCRGFRGRNLLN